MGLHRAHHAPIESGINGGHRCPHLQGGHYGPKTGALLAGLIHDLLDQVGAVIGIFGAQAHLGDLHQIGVELFGGIPGLEHLGDLLAVHALDPLHQVIGLGQDLLDAVLNAVVHGLDEVARAAWADVGDTGAVFHLGSHLGHQAFDGVVGGFGAARHHARPL